MLAADVPNYLLPEYDPSKATTPELMRILITHDVPLPPKKEKKEVYVGLFQQHIVSRRGQLIAEYTRPVHATTPPGPGQASISTPITERKRKTGNSRASSSKAPINVDDDDEEVNFSDDNPFQSGGEESPEKAADRKMKLKRRKSVAPPGTAGGIIFSDDEATTPASAVKRNTLRNKTGASPQPFMFKTRTPDVNFSKTGLDGPFGAEEGSGGNGAGAPSGSSRKTTKRQPAKPRQRAAQRAWTDDDGSSSPPKTTGNIIELEDWKSVLPSPTTRIATPKPAATPTAQRTALKKAVPRKERKEDKPNEVTAANMIFRVVVSVFIILLLHWLYMVKDTIGYCEPSNSYNSNNLEAMHGGRWNPLVHVLPSHLCLSCPTGATCVGDTVLSCQNPEHILEPLSPIPTTIFPLNYMTCVENKYKLATEARQAQQVDRLVSHLDQVVRSWIGRAQCGELSADEASMIPAWAKDNGRVWGMPPAEAKRQLQLAIGQKWSSQRFEEHWDLLLRRITPGSSTHLPAAAVRTAFDKTGRHLLLVSSLEPIISFSCRIKSSVWQTIRTYSTHLAVTSLACILAAVWYDKSVTTTRESKMIGSLVDDVLNSLAQANEQHQDEPDRYPLPGITVDQLRDHLLPVPVHRRRLWTRTSGSTGEQQTSKDVEGRTKWHLDDDASRERIWKQVSDVVTRNAMVRETSMEVKGEMHTIWQWIANDVLSPRRSSSMGNLTSMGSRASGFGGGFGAGGSGGGASGSSVGQYGSPVVPALAKRLSTAQQGQEAGQITSGPENYPSL
ncbi:hypothetical protein SmJEL517_g02543 [Synchytrium microbalum]|uniref:LEM-like domain-containing protein n=1 Tax=Synchytrium microbalum TaxID=1806994 RepID=A0A507C5V8_9FUNG|nr:uncharacterized protein SmJEL517_g02543 [Synchytrium microbalum]TPX34891.1 hypothetical protein SmJEL517_g02543 [Synchytrium microbalum]